MLGPWSSTRCKYILVMEIDLKAAVQMGEAVCRRSLEPSNHLSLIRKVQEMVGHRRRMGFKGLVGSTFRCRTATGGRAQTRNLISHDRHDRRQPLPFSTSHHHDDHRSSKASTSLQDRILSTVFRLTVLIDSGKQEHEDIRSDTTVQRLNTRCD